MALYGEVAAELYQGVADIEGAAYYDNALRLRDMGRLLLATEVLTLSYPILSHLISCCFIQSCLRFFNVTILTMAIAMP